MHPSRIHALDSINKNSPLRYSLSNFFRARLPKALVCLLLLGLLHLSIPRDPPLSMVLYEHHFHPERGVQTTRREKDSALYRHGD